MEYILAVYVNDYYPNRVELDLGALPGPLTNALGAVFNPSSDLELYVDGVLTTLASWSFDNNLNRYLLYTSSNIDLTGVVQLIHHMPLPPFEQSVFGFGAAFGLNFGS